MLCPALVMKMIIGANIPVVLWVDGRGLDQLKISINSVKLIWVAAWTELGDITTVNVIPDSKANAFYWWWWWAWSHKNSITAEFIGQTICTELPLTGFKLPTLPLSYALKPNSRSWDGLTLNTSNSIRLLFLLGWHSSRITPLVSHISHIWFEGTVNILQLIVPKTLGLIGICKDFL